MPSHRLADRVIWLVGRTSLQAQRLISEHIAAGPARKHHYGILATLADSGPATQTTLSERLGIDRSDLVSQLDELESSKLLLRRVDPADRRRNIVEISQAGREALEDLDGVVARAENELLAPLNSEERKLLASLLARLVTGVDTG